MPWPGIIPEAFQLAQPDGRLDESRFYGPYTLLLSHLFPMDESHNEHPVFFVEVKPSGHVDHISSRESADKQMRKRYKDLGGGVELPILYGMSALGTKVCFYTYDKGTRSILPKTIKDDGDLVIDTAPADHWSLDVMTADGERKLREVVNQVKVMCAQL